MSWESVGLKADFSSMLVVVIVWRFTFHSLKSPISIGEPSVPMLQLGRCRRWSFVELSFVALTMNHLVMPLNRTKFDTLNGLRRLQQHMEQINQQSLIEMLPWTHRQSAAASRAIQCKKCTIHSNCSSIICTNYEFHSEATFEFLLAPRRPNRESSSLSNRSND